MSTNKHNFLVIITGPTAVGKTEISIDLAKKYDSEIFSADSRQIYKEMNIGTAKITSDEMSGVKHHFINHISVAENYSTGQYERDFDKKVEGFFKRNSIGIVTGGTGLYIKAILEGLDEFPAVSEDILSELNQRLHEEGIDKLVEELRSRDPIYTQTVDVHNSRRVIRALSVCIVSSKPYSHFLNLREPKITPFNPIKVCLTRDREELYDRINRRVDLMMKAGLLQEVKGLYPHRHLKSLQTVGYQEIFKHLEGELSLSEAVELIKRNTRRYAKRQITWFKNQGEWNMFDANQPELILNHIDQILNSNEQRQM